MKKCLVCLLVLLLSACAAPVWETVKDEIPAVAVSAGEDDSYTIQVGVPENLSLCEERNGWQLYAAQDGALEVETRTFLTSGLDSAVRMVSGFEAEKLTILKTTRFDMPEYQFAWAAQTEQGMRLYRADLVLDGMTCYAVVCSHSEDVGTGCDTQIRQVFSSFGLFTDEGV